MTSDTSAAAPTRELTLTKKVNTRYGNMYVHMTHTNGRVTHVAFSQPGKFDNTAMADVFMQLGAAATQLAREISELPEEFI